MRWTAVCQAQAQYRTFAYHADMHPKSREFPTRAQQISRFLFSLSLLHLGLRACDECQCRRCTRPTKPLRAPRPTCLTTAAALHSPRPEIWSCDVAHIPHRTPQMLQIDDRSTTGMRQRIMGPARGNFTYVESSCIYVNCSCSTRALLITLGSLVASSEAALVPRWPAGGAVSVQMLIVSDGLSPWLRNSPRFRGDGEQIDLAAALAKDVCHAMQSASRQSRHWSS